MQPLAWEPPYVAGAALKTKKEKKKKERKKKEIVPSLGLLRELLDIVSLVRHVSHHRPGAQQALLASLQDHLVTKERQAG